MNKIAIAGLSFLIFEASARASVSDTTKTYRFDEVVVTATRTKIPITSSPSGIELIDADQIQNANGSTVADIIRNGTGVFLRDQGAHGALKTVSIRGTSSSQTLVLVNGLRYSTFQNGLVDLSLLPLYDIERIEVARGGSSALYGADALGGVINILTRKPDRTFRARTEFGGGSFGYEHLLQEVQGGAGPLGVLVGFSSERGRDDYPFLQPRFGQNDTTVRRSNDDFQRRQEYLHANVTVDDRSEFSFSAQHVFADRGVPGFSIFPTLEARQNDDDVNLSAGFARDHGLVRFNVLTGYHLGLQRFNDPDPFFPINSFYKNIHTSIHPQVQLRFGDTYAMTFGGEYDEGTLSSNDFDGRITRVQKALFLTNELHLNWDRRFMDRISLYQMVRYDNISDVDVAVTPKLGFNVRIVREGDIRLRGSIGQSFRAPSFNDLYFRNFSNPLLKPERSVSVDAGIMGRVDGIGSHAMEISYFQLRTEKRILFDPVIFLPVNIGTAVSKGVEIQYTGSYFSDVLQFSVNYTYSNVRKLDRTSDTDPTYNTQLVYVPWNAARFVLGVRISNAVLNLIYSGIGERFTKQDNTASLPGYRLVDANVRISIPFSSSTVFAKIEGNNLFDRRYEIFEYYPMPGRSFRVTVGAEY